MKTDAEKISQNGFAFTFSNISSNLKFKTGLFSIFLVLALLPAISGAKDFISYSPDNFWLDSLYVHKCGKGWCYGYPGTYYSHDHYVMHIIEVPATKQRQILTALCRKLDRDSFGDNDYNEGHLTKCVIERKGLAPKVLNIDNPADWKVRDSSDSPKCNILSELQCIRRFDQ